MSRTTNKVGKRVYFNENRVLLKDSKGAVLGNFFLKRTTPSEIINQRTKIAKASKIAVTDDKTASTSALCIVRFNGKYSIAQIPNNISFSGIACQHCCSECMHCYASSTAQNGCPKILDRTLELGTRNYSVRNAVLSSSRIERYPFIIAGIETVGCANTDVFIVCKCENFCKDSREAKEVNVELTDKLLSAYNQLQKEPEDPPRLIKRRKKILFPYNVHPYH